MRNRLALGLVLVASFGAAPIAFSQDGAPHRGLFGPIPAPGAPTPCDHAGEVCCGADARALAARFSNAIRRAAGRSHRVGIARAPGRPPHPAVAGEALVSVSDPRALAWLVALRGVAVLREVPALGIYVVARPGADPALLAAECAALPGVRSASPNYVARTAAVIPNDAHYPVQRPGAKWIGLEEAWSLSRGTGVTVAVLDTGADGTHPDLLGAIGAYVDIVNGAGALPPAQARDDNGHGTAIAGIIAARFQNGVGTAGVAPEASVIAIKVADREGAASFGDLVAGIDEAVRRRARVIVIALGAWVSDPALDAAVSRAVASGAVLIAAAGNENVNAPAWPAACAGVVATGGASDDGRLAFTTVLAPSLALLAPSENVVAPVPGGISGFIRGTSAAAAYAAGAAALAIGRAPQLSGADVARLLATAGAPVPVLEDAKETFPFGRLDARAVVERADPALVDLAVLSLVALPREPEPGQAVTLRVRVRNDGNAALASALLKTRFYPPGTASPIEIQPLLLQNLAPGEVRSVDARWTANLPSAPGALDIEARFDPLPGEADTQDNVIRAPLRFAAGPLVDVRVATLAARPDHAARAVYLEGIVRNLGTRDEAQVEVEFAANGVVFARSSIQALFVGQDLPVVATWPFPVGGGVGGPGAPPLPERVSFEVRLLARPGETATGDNAAAADVRLGTAVPKPIDVLYQQSNGVDLVSDAPFRVVDGVPYVPLLLFCPSKGDRDPDTYLTFSRVEVFAKDDPAPGAPATLLYQDSTNAPATFVHAGIEPLDENGVVPMRGGVPDQEIMQDERLTRNGRHMLLRIPRAALGVAPSPPPGTAKYLDVRMAWEFHRRILWIFNVTRDGVNKKVLRVQFGPPLPAVPGENHYYDVHHHTIAEWFFSSVLNVFAPRKAYGGPIVMTAESAYALGMIPSPTAVNGLVTTTDHNTFFNETAGDPNDEDRRPPFGPTSPAQSVGSGGTIVPEHARYREIFGIAAGEEVAYEQEQSFSLSGVIALAIPLGGHMVSFRGEHVEGPWHGGGWIPDPGSPSITVPLGDVLARWAQGNQAVNRHAFVYAAHPFSDMLGMSPQNRDLALGLDPLQRTLDHVHASPPGFVFKGFQLFNGRGTRAVPSDDVDFEDLNPFVNATWQAGSPDWDAKLKAGLVEWHRAIAALMSYSFLADPDGVFVRKAFIAGGSDAHGDYNYDVNRLATPISFQFTYGAGGSPYGCTRTYVLGDGLPGVTPEERFMEAFAAGRSVATDGPIVTFTMDAEGRFDEARLVWHDARSAPEDHSGRMGGGGAFDGEGTMLVARGATEVWFRYQHANAADFGSAGGALAAIKIYKDEAGVPGPTFFRGSIEEPLSRGSLAVGAPGTPLAEKIDPAEEGLIELPTAFALGGYTGNDPEVTPIGIDEHRCYTNPLWALPVDVSIACTAPPGASRIDPGELTAVFTFPVSMDGGAWAVEVKPLDASGTSTDGSVPGSPMTVSWSAAGGARNARLTAVNDRGLSLGGDAYPAAGQKTFVIYFRDPPRDLHGNALNRLAVTVTVPRSGGSTSSPSSGGRSGGGGGGGGCAVGPLGAGAALPYFALVALLGGIALAARAGRAPAPKTATGTARRAAPEARRP